MTTVFGTAGIPLCCKGDNVEGIKQSISMELGAYEVEFVRGVKMSPLMARKMQEISKEHNIKVSCHAPYYLNCNNEEKYAMTERQLIDCIKVNEDLPLTRIVFHVGYLMKDTRADALKHSINAIKRIVDKAYLKGYKNFTLGPELAGKHSQIGTTDELIAICKEVKECKPVIDWAHLHATTNGGLKKEKDFAKPIDQIENELGKKYLEGLHCHYSNIHYSDKGELNHEKLDDGFGPDFRILAALIKKNNYNFTIISESPLIEQDALKMKSILENL